MLFHLFILLAIVEGFGSFAFVASMFALYVCGFGCFAFAAFMFALYVCGFGSFAFAACMFALYVCDFALFGATYKVFACAPRPFGFHRVAFAVAGWGRFTLRMWLVCLYRLTAAPAWEASRT